MGLYFIPSFTVFFSVISFFLNGSFFSADYRVVEPLASDVCSLDSEVNPGTFAGFFEGGSSACHLVGRAMSHPSAGHLRVKGRILRQMGALYNFKQTVY